MANMRSVLDLEEHERIRRRDWRFERIGWGVIAGLLAAGLAGLFGDGKLASATVASRDGGVVAHFDRMVRHGAPSKIELRLAPSVRADTEVVISLDEAYLDAVDVNRVIPEPLRVRASAARVEYHLLRLDPTSPMTIALSVQPGTTGARRVVLGSSHGPLVIRQFVLP